MADFSGLALIQELASLGSESEYERQFRITDIQHTKLQT